MDRQISLKTYMISTLIVWLAILVASAAILQDSPYFNQMLLILAGGIVWFVIILPAGLFKEGLEK
ncbi:MAG: hypothetical protein IBX69_05470 [Anaerolineales bacterium]|nr:hypothetical protein [Anaerolineales bacterium]